MVVDVIVVVDVVFDVVGVVVDVIFLKHCKLLVSIHRY